jgi:hypothetical protein
MNKDMKARDYIAATAMQVLLQRVGIIPGYDEKSVVKDAYTMADLMILESSK